MRPAEAFPAGHHAVHDVHDEGIVHVDDVTSRRASERAISADPIAVTEGHEPYFA